MSATHSINSTGSVASVLYVAFELSAGQWKLASTTARGQRGSRCVSAGQNIASVRGRSLAPKPVSGIPESRCGLLLLRGRQRDGFWLDRCLHHHGINNVIVDSSSIEVNRFARAAKADGLDAVSLVGLLARLPRRRDECVEHGQRPRSRRRRPKAYAPRADQLRRERTTTVTASVVCSPPSVSRSRGRTSCVRPSRLAQAVNGEPVPEGLKRRLLHELERMDLLARHIKVLEIEQAEQIRNDQTLHCRQGPEAQWDSKGSGKLRPRFWWPSSSAGASLRIVVRWGHWRG